MTRQRRIAAHFLGLIVALFLAGCSQLASTPVRFPTPSPTARFTRPATAAVAPRVTPTLSPTGAIPPTAAATQPASPTVGPTATVTQTRFFDPAGIQTATPAAPAQCPKPVAGVAPTLEYD